MTDSGSLSDEAIRDVFVKNWSSNLSLIAPAGTGKTHCISERIGGIMSSGLHRPESVLEKLVVVTFTVKAAHELQQRVRDRLLKKNSKSPTELPLCLTALSRAYFGTIHGFCLHLLTQYGHYLGLIPRVTLLEDEEKLWTEFLDTSPGVIQSIPEDLIRLLPLDQLLQLARKFPPDETPEITVKQPSPHEFNLKAIEAVKEKGRGAGNIQTSRDMARSWLERWKKNLPAPLPHMRGKSKDLTEAWVRTLSPLQNWVAEVAAKTAAQISREFAAYRLNKGTITYDDMVRLALKLFDHSDARKAIQREVYHVVLDEAQDTDPLQFRVLLCAAGGDPTLDIPVPPQGRFVMVGDPQQSIYRDRADIHTYLACQEAIIKQGGQKLTLRTTFRCDKAIIKTVNAAFPALLDGKDGQAEFVSLEARPGAGPGQVWRLPVPAGSFTPSAKSLNQEKLLQYEADFLARWLRSVELTSLGATVYSDIAIICPRREWLQILASALHRHGLAAQLHSTHNTLSQHPTFAWIHALVTIMLQPRNSFEIYGVLRDIFGIPDQTLAYYTKGLDHLLRIDLPPGEVSEPVSQCLLHLHELRASILTQDVPKGFFELLSGCALKERLATLPNDLSHQNVMFLRQAQELADSCASVTWTEFLQRLEQCSLQTLEAGNSAPQSIQLITSKKSKGLQWPVVIVPFLKTPDRFPTTKYPEVFRLRASAPPKVLLKDDHTNKEDLDTLQQDRQRETARLLYVVCTRAQRSLIFIDDLSLPWKSGENLASQASRLDLVTNQKPKWWDKIDEMKVALEESTAPPSHAPSISLPPEPESHEESKLNVDPSWFNFIKRKLPHQLGIHPREKTESAETPAEFLLTSRLEWANAGSENPAIRYGLWWHAQMQWIPWDSNLPFSDGQIEQIASSSSDKDRALHELRLLSQSKIWEKWQPCTLFRTEIPFLYQDQEDPSTCVEGVIDLVVRILEGPHWHIWDWKTDQVESTDQLLNRHQAQLQAYAKALHAHTGEKVSAWLYSTYLGQAIMIGLS